jgi:ribosomal protein L7Ae-like RNA K-turn-binding protein
MDRNLQLLGITKKAGLLAVGSDAVSVAARSGRAWLIITAFDASEGTVRRATSNAKENGSLYAAVPYSKYELGMVAKRGSPGTLAILDVGLAAQFMSGLAETDPLKYEKIAEMLANEAHALAKRNKHTPSGKRRTMQ